MTAFNDRETASPVVLEYKTPTPLVIVLSIGIAVLLAGVASTLFYTHQYDVALGLASLLGGLMGLLYANNRGYRIAWDDERIYMREWGFRDLFRRGGFHSIRYEDISSIKGRTRSGAGAGSKLVPYEYLEVFSKYDNEETIWLYPLSIEEEDFNRLLLYLYERRPDVIPDKVAKLIQKHGCLEKAH